MSRLSVRVSAASTTNVLTERDKRMAITPTLPAQPHERGITYEEIAAAMGLDVATICSWLAPAGPAKVSG